MIIIGYTFTITAVNITIMTFTVITIAIVTMVTFNHPTKLRVEADKLSASTVCKTYKGGQADRSSYPGLRVLGFRV